MTRLIEQYDRAANLAPAANAVMAGIRALELLGKESGMFIDRSKNEHKFDVSLAEALDALKARRGDT